MKNRIIQKMYLEHQVIITELGWSTDSTENGHHAIVLDEIKEIFYDPDEPKRASIENAKYYLEELNKWIEDEQIIAFYFEAFDELWKGSSEKSSECNFGIYNNDKLYPNSQTQKNNYRNLRKNSHSSSLQSLASSERMSQWNTCGRRLSLSP